MKMTEPIGNSLYAPMFLRFALGAYFLIAGLTKLDNIYGFVAEVHKFGVLPDHFGTVYGIMLPYLEVMVGVMLFFGMWTTFAAIVAGILLLSFIYAFGFFPTGSNLFNKDVILLAVAVSILYSGAGAFSVDRFRKQG